MIMVRGPIAPKMWSWQRNGLRQIAGVQTCCIEEMHKNFEINDIDRVWMECCENGDMPGDTSVEWAKAMSMIKLPELDF